MQDGTPKCDADSLMTMMMPNSAVDAVGYTIYIMDISELWAYACGENVSIDRELSTATRTYHGLYVRMWNGVKFVELKLVLWSNVYICSFVLGTVAVLWC